MVDANDDDLMMLLLLFVLWKTICKYLVMYWVLPGNDFEIGG